MPLELFHPAVAGWFRRRFGAPTEAQALAWPSIKAGRHTLVAAPTGSGKTLAAFLAALDDLVREGLEGGQGTLPDETRVVYVSPLKALSADIQRNLREPLEGIREALDQAGLRDPGIRTAVRSGDTPSGERARMVRRPPHVLVTTPESLYLLLTSARGREMLRTARTVIVDEIHAVAGDKRGSHLSLTLERLDDLAADRLVRIGLSATQSPIEEVARFLVGRRHVSADGAPRCDIHDAGHARRLDLAVEVPGSPLEAAMAAEVWSEVYDRLAALAREHRTTLVFVNTRRLAERVARHLEDRLGPGLVTSHHGSLAREHRQDAERRLKEGSLRALVATASLELGIDIGHVDLVCQIGSPRSIATLVQRVGRSGHTLGGTPKGRLFPLSRDELVECAALLDAVRRGELDRLEVPAKPLDVLAQQIVAEVACGERSEDDLFALCRSAWPYRDLGRGEFDAVLRMLAEGYRTSRGRRGRYLHRDAVGGLARARRGARLVALTSGGAIPEQADYKVVLEPSGALIGTLDEDFSVESMPGDVFQLGTASWRILRVEMSGRVRVEDARGQPPTIPFWLGEAPGRTRELSAAVSRLREEAGGRIGPDGSGRAEAAARFASEVGLAEPAAEQLAEYLDAGGRALGRLPTQRRVVLERFFDEAGDQHVVLHAPFGSRVNRAWGLALRKRFCRSFNFELQAAATDDALVLSLGPTHSFALEDVFRYLRSTTVRDLLVQALLDAPMFGVRWRWNANRALAVPRWSRGRRVPPPLQRQQAEDLLATVFPDQLACLENVVGDREVPDHPLVAQTVADCLHEAMDVEGLEAVLRAIEDGRIETDVRDLREPSPLAHEILGARPYAFLDDAPLEERRTRAVATRRWADPEAAAEFGSLDAAAIAAVRDEARPRAQSADELHDALMQAGLLTREETETRGWAPLFGDLVRAGRAFEARPDGGPTLRAATERVPLLRAAFEGARLETLPEVTVPERFAAEAWTPETALAELLRGRLEIAGPVTAGALATSLGLAGRRIEAALIALESEGYVLRGRFTPGLEEGETEWCERGLLARIHRRTLDRLRREIEPVCAADFLRFLFDWQRVAAEERAEGPEGLAAVLAQLEGFEAAAAAWEGDLLPARVADYDPAWLDGLCLSGRAAWCRLSPPSPAVGRRAVPLRSTPVAVLARRALAVWRTDPPRPEPPGLTEEARRVAELIEARGASFFAEIVEGTGLLKVQVEQALAELVYLGLAASDAFTGLRALLVPSDRRPTRQGRWARGRASAFGMEEAGRWSLLPGTAADGSRPVEEIALALLRRYGVVFRRLLLREGRLPPWRELLRVYRRLEARGEVRGGRFVDGFSGEQYALPEAVGRLRAVRRRPGDGDLVAVSAADPLNLAGVLTPGDRLAATAGNRLLYRDGVPAAALESGRIRPLVPMTPAEAWEARTALERQPAPPELRAYLGRKATSPGTAAPLRRRG